MIFVRQNNATGVHIGPILFAGAGNDQTMLISSNDLSLWACRYVKGVSIQGDIALVEATNISLITSGAKPFMNFNPGASYFDTLGAVSFCFIYNSNAAVYTVNCWVLAPETYDLFFAATGSTLQDELDALQTSFDTTIAPNVVGGASLSGTGFLSDSVSRLRQIVEESSINEKYSDADMIRYIKSSMQSVLTDVNANTDHPVVVRWSFPIVADKQVYTFPANCQKLYRITKIEDTYGTVEWEILPGSRWDFGNAGFRLEGNSMRLMAKWKAGYTVQLEYVPNGESQPHKGSSVQIFGTSVAAGSAQGDAIPLSYTHSRVTGADGTKGGIIPTASAGLNYLVHNTSTSSSLKVYPNTSDTIDGGTVNVHVTLAAGEARRFVATDAVDWVSSVVTDPEAVLTIAATPIDGTLDTRPDAFAGYLLRILSSTDVATATVYTQDRLIASYNNQTRVATLVEAFNPPLAGTITYEILPQYSGLIQDVVCLHAALTLHGLEGATKKYALTKDIYEKRMRALRTQLRKEFRVGPVFENQTTTNSRTNPWAGRRGF